jgi:hypothetical protein
MSAPQPPSDGSWFQIIVGAVLAILTAGGTWLQMQISWLRRDNERTEDRAVAAVNVLRAEILARQDRHEEIQDGQHRENQQQHAEDRATLDRLSDRVGDLAVAVATLAAKH